MQQNTLTSADYEESVNKMTVLNNAIATIIAQVRVEAE